MKIALQQLFNFGQTQQQQQQHKQQQQQHQQQQQQCMFTLMSLEERNL